MTPEQAAAYAAESDEIVKAIYEDALMDEEPWALEAYAYRAERIRGKTVRPCTGD